MIRIYHPYTAWEDWRAGMWSPLHDDDAVSRAAHILSSPNVFRAAARDMLRDWPRSAEQNLTGGLNNHRAWIGQATCCHLAGVPEEQTRESWWTLTETERRAANAVADQVIAEWLRCRELDQDPDLLSIIPEPRLPGED